MTRVVWRWAAKDFGFRFQAKSGRNTIDYYQATNAGDYYIVPAAQRKLEKARIAELAAATPSTPNVVAIPWQNYDRHWDWITNEDGSISLNFAGCLDLEEIHRREDEGVARAMQFVADVVARPEPVPLSIDLVRQVHRELMGDIYPFAGEWRTVDLHKGDGPVKWPLPRVGIQPLMDLVQQQVFARSPFFSDSDEEVFGHLSQMMCDLLAVHPFREGNGRAVFVLANLVLMQNELVPLDAYDRKRDEPRYFAACEAGRIHKDYGPMAALLGEWEEAALKRWEEDRGR